MTRIVDFGYSFCLWWQFMLEWYSFQISLLMELTDLSHQEHQKKFAAEILSNLFHFLNKPIIIGSIFFITMASLSVPFSENCQFLNNYYNAISNVWISVKLRSSLLLLVASLLPFLKFSKPLHPAPTIPIFKAKLPSDLNFTWHSSTQART